MAKKSPKAHRGGRLERRKPGHFLKSRQDLARHISYDYEGRKRKLEAKKDSYVLPAGIKVLIAYLSVLLFFHISYFLIGLGNEPIALIFGQFVAGDLAFLIVSGMTAGIILLIYGLAKRKKWSFYFALAWFAFGIINAIISLVFSKYELIAVTKNLAILSAASILIINILIISYLISEKRFFFAERFVQKRFGASDRAFIAATVLFLAVVIVIAIFIGYDFFNSNLKVTDSIIGKMNGKSESEQIALCNSQTAQQEKDICFIVAAVKQNSPDLCNQISSEFYRMTCLRA